MPCSDGLSYTNTRVEYVESGSQTKRLCAVFSVLQNLGTLSKILDKVDWKEAGISRKSTEEWWERHQEEDRQRIKREKAQRDREASRRAVLSKLSPEERAILGVK